MPRKGRKRPIPVPHQRMVVIGGNDLDLMFNARLQAASNPRKVQSYSSRHKILIVGDGDLTFALSIATALGSANLVATTFDTRRELLRKYQGVKSTIDSLQRIGCKVVHGVDATKLEAVEELEVGVDMFQRIVFNFPHIGGSTQEDVKLNQELLLQYFKQSKLFLTPNGGEAHVALRSTSFYDSWDVVGQAEEAGFRLLRKEPFQTDNLLSYENQRTSGESTMRQAPSIENAVRYRFVVAQSNNSQNTNSTDRKGERKADHNHQQQQCTTKKKKALKVPMPNRDFSISTSGSESLDQVKKRKQEEISLSTSTTDAFTSSSSEVNPSLSVKNKKKKKQKKKKSRLSLFQKKEDDRVASKKQ
jgi:25S rRNA (uracil2634-N3)-methyltransferase